MREKTLKLIVTFHTTAEAMSMEKACKEHKIEGRLIPVPRAISSGCGLSWCSQLEERSRIEALLSEIDIEEEALQECMV